MSKKEEDDASEAPDVEEEVAAIDSGLAPGNYFNYKDHDVALQAEVDLLDELTGYYCDKEFPADGRALYFDPTHPPKGALPNSTIKWNRICTGEVMDCNKPVFCTGRSSTPLIVRFRIKGFCTAHYTYSLSTGFN